MDAILLYIEFINQYINSNYFYSIVIFFMFLTFYSTLSIPGGVILFISSGFFFNLYLGFFINLFSISIGSIIFHISCKLILKFFFPNFYLNYSQKVTNIIKNSSNEYLILFRMIPGPPLFVKNLCLSIINISKFKFFYTTLIGFIPYMFIFSLVGSEMSNLVELKNFNLQQIFSSNFILLLLVLIFLILFRILFKKKRPSN